ncbi:GyrI-like domain-containing protein [Rapidithrix thailandica]|uniref:GyrI-like domain-containing protein n=1 Tax=Rapidithrix thailandica TaxID=413964 RepID=A0AAW9SFV8_9BACT
MNRIKIANWHLIGLALPFQTSNVQGQSSIDCGNLWQQFTTEKYTDRIPNKLDENIFAVYHNYEEDSSFSYFIGCRVAENSPVPPGMDRLTIPEGSYMIIVAKGKMPDCMVNTWKDIWNSDIPRAYRTDFEVYSEKSKNWDKAEVDIYLSLMP